MASLWKLSNFCNRKQSTCYGHVTCVRPLRLIYILEAPALTFLKLSTVWIILSVKAAGDKAVKHCRSGKRPYILEIKTYDIEAFHVRQQSTEPVKVENA